MSSYTVMQPQKWDRADTFHFFKDFDIPHFNVTVNVDVSALKRHCKERGYSFFISSIFYSQKALASIPNFHYRFADNEVREYTQLEAGSTILLPNNTFGFNYFGISSDFESYHARAKRNIAELQNNPQFTPRGGGLNMVFYSVTPWFSFTSFQHARKFDAQDAIPRIVFGKYFEQDGKWWMPISVEAHHAFVDGYHVGKYFEHLEKCFLDL